MYGNAAFAYQAQQVRGVSKVRQVAMLYDRAIASLKEAIQAIEDKEIERRWRANKRAQDIVLALYGALDEEAGGEIARNLSQIYMFALRRLPRVDLRNDPTPAQEVIELLEPLRRSWYELAEREQQGPLVDDEPGGAQAPRRQAGTQATAAPQPGSSERVAVNITG
jgi:flagellar protein FliS